MPDPIILEPPATATPAAATGHAALDSYLADASAAQDAFFQQASDAFDAQARGAQAAAQPAAKPGAASAAPAPAAATPQPATTPAAAKPAIPSFKPPDAAPPAAPAAEPASDEPPREYRPGSIKREQWDQLHARRDAAVAEAQTLKQRITALQQRDATGEPPPELKARLDALARERDEYQQRLEAVAVERSPRFEAAFKPRLDGALALAKSVVPLDKQARVAELLALPDTQWRNAALEEIAGSLTGLAAGKFANAVAQVDSVAAEKAAAASRSSETFRQWTAEQQQRDEQQRAARLAESEQVLGTELQGFGDLLVGDTPAVKARAETARQIFLGGLDMSSLARASGWAAVGPELASQLTAVTTELASVKADLARLRGAQPGSGSDASAAQGAATPEIDPATSYADAIAQSVANLGLLR